MNGSKKTLDGDLQKEKTLVGDSFQKLIAHANLRVRLRLNQKETALANVN
jgi:hypothetical protein